MGDYSQLDMNIHKKNGKDVPVRLFSQDSQLHSVFGLSSQSSHIIVDTDHNKNKNKCHNSKNRQDENNNDSKAIGTDLMEKSKEELHSNCSLNSNIHQVDVQTTVDAISVQNMNIIKSSNALSHTVSPPADHYNMQLLAYSAQRQQQILQKELQHYQPNQQLLMCNQGSSSAALEKLARLQQQQKFVASSEEETKVNTNSYNSPHFQVMHESAKINQHVKSLQPSFFVSRHQDHSTPELAHGHFRDSLFGSQDNFVGPVQSNSAANCPEPELKSPLDYPEHQFNLQQRQKFFSANLSSASEQPVDEAPLNERDKEAAAALGILLEQSEKATQISADFGVSRLPNVVSCNSQICYPSSSSRVVGSSLPIHLMQLQSKTPNMPSPAYEHSISMEHGFQHLQQGVVHTDASFMTAALLNSGLSNHEMETGDRVNNHIDREQKNSAVTTRQYFPTNFTLHEPDNEITFYLPKIPDDNSDIVPASLPMSGLETNTRASNSSLNENNNCVVPMQNNACNPSQTSASMDNAIIRTTRTPTKATAAAVRMKRTNSSGSNSSSRKSNGSRTCNLCGHSFRSAPALNGHMRVHSNSEKKHNKEERHVQRSAAPSSFAIETIASASGSMKDIMQASFVNISQPSISHLSSSTVSKPVEVDHVLQPCKSEFGNQHSHLHPRNGLLTMASAACLLQTEPIAPEYLHQSSLLPIPQGYAMPHTVLVQKPAMMNTHEAEPDVKANYDPVNEQSAAYSQLSQPMPLNLIFNMPLPASICSKDAGGYVVNQQSHVTQDSTTALLSPECEAGIVNPQSYVNSLVAVDMPTSVAIQDESCSYPYDMQHIPGTNSLSQLASIAVAANGHENATVQSECISSFVNEIKSSPGSVNHNVASEIGWLPSEHATVNRNQQPLYPNPSLAPETSPLRSGHDPFIFPVSVPIQKKLQAKYSGLECPQPANDSSFNRSRTIKWQDHQYVRNNDLISSLDDPLMQEALNVANPSKILPNSMMGGTPPVASVFSNIRPFRQRHFSEGAHLIKSAGTNVLKQLLDIPVVAVEKKKENDASEDQEMVGLMNPESVIKKENNLPKTQIMDTAPKELEKKKEVWAEPKPVQRRVRRRHSADCRLLSKSCSISGTSVTQQHVLTNSPTKKCGTLCCSKRKIRHRPPPLVIPSSVNAFTPFYVNCYQSHLRHNRRPSCESNSSYKGVNDKIPPYTPPPMLSPIRAGSGLYCMTPVTAKTMFSRQKESMDGAGSIPTIIEEDETSEDADLIRSSEPKINIGSRFQAVMPIICKGNTSNQCKHRADRVWNLSNMVACNGDIFNHLEQFMELSCSAVVPYGGSNKEYALDCVSKTNGDILAAVMQLVSKKRIARPAHEELRKYVGSGRRWTTQEVKLFDNAMLEHWKDFNIISQMVKTRSTAECVERYYHVVKRNRRGIQVPLRYREPANDFFSLLSPSSSPVQMSVTSGSSSDDETDRRKSSTYSVSDRTSWLANTAHGVDSLTTSYSSSRISGNKSDNIVKSMKKNDMARLLQQRLDVVSPSISPSSIASNDEQPPQIFSCPVCGKSFTKVKSRNAHMKTHGKQAQEKRRLREEEAARRQEELAKRRLPSVPKAIPVQNPTFVHNTVNTSSLYQHPYHHLHNAMPAFKNNT